MIKDVFLQRRLRHMVSGEPRHYTLNKRYVITKEILLIEFYKMLHEDSLIVAKDLYMGSITSPNHLTRLVASICRNENGKFLVISLGEFKNGVDIKDGLKIDTEVTANMGNITMGIDVIYQRAHAIKAFEARPVNQTPLGVFLMDFFEKNPSRKGGFRYSQQHLNKVIYHEVLPSTMFLRKFLHNYNLTESELKDLMGTLEATIDIVRGYGNPREAKNISNLNKIINNVVK